MLTRPLSATPRGAALFLLLALLLTAGCTRREQAVSRQPKPAPARLYERWHWQGPARPTGPAVLTPAGWAVGFEGGHLAVIDWAGRPVWTQQHAGVTLSAPAAVGAFLGVSEQSGGVRLLRAADGSPVWRQRIEGAFRHAPIACRGGGRDLLAVLSQEDGRVTALNPVDGAVVWQSPATERSDGPLTAASNRLAYGNCASAVHVVDASDGRLAASVSVGENAQMAGGLAVAGAMAIGLCRDGAVAAIDLEKPRLAWRSEVGAGESFTTPLLSDGCAWIGTDDGYLVEMDVADGAVRQRVRVGNGRAESPCLAGGWVWTACDGAVIAVDGSGRRPAVRLELGRPLTAPAAANGQVIVCSDDGFVIAVESGG